MNSWYAVTKLLSTGICLGLTFCILGCDGTGNQQVNRDAFTQAIEQQEVKRILPAEFVEAAYTQGESIAMQAQEIAISGYPPETETLEDLSNFVDEPTLVKIDSLAKAQNAEVRWIPADADSARLQLSTLEQQLWEAYWYNVENDLPVNHNVQKIDEENYLYTNPVMLTPELRKKLAGAETFADNSFLGMWSIKLTKRELIRAM
ncbi:hypothetical protein [Catalinimonas niigatensis]|uniref:hypothetical protein n=1 Tax=Catalinimonas niigatensis TaxID=1397264 RepID=UPI00266508CE|nr:hypothetical protein [Catalinimonas niigatensis]WPP53280.1 hypothetical protein PZB72_12945 [Catalinimonas niigatensis]